MNVVILNVFTGSRRIHSRHADKNEAYAECNRWNDLFAGRGDELAVVAYG